MAMSVVHNGVHSICFWKKTYDSGGTYFIGNPRFTWDDFHLIPNARPAISIPKVNYTIATIPNSNKRINITSYLTGGMTYESRTGEWQFCIDHNSWPDWTEAHYDIEEYFNGSKMLVTLDDGRADVYEGRVWLSGYEAGDSYSTVTIAYDLDAEPISDYSDMNFRVRFIGLNGRILQNDRLPYNDTPYFRGSIPTYSHLKFRRWRPTLDKVTRNVDYIAEYRQGGRNG